MQHFCPQVSDAEHFSAPYMYQHLDSANYEAFRECVFSAILEQHSSRPMKISKKREVDANGIVDSAELLEFSDYIASEAFVALPVELIRLSYQSFQTDISQTDKWSLPLTVSAIEELACHVPPGVTDSLFSYGLLKPPQTDLESFLSRTVTQYIGAVTVPPPKWIETKTSSCQICDRDWVPLTYHHLIPKQIHAKALKRSWHEESQLNSVAWLCRACHSFVHKMASNEELARNWFTVDRICEREDVQRWAQWIGRIRWKKQ